MALSKFELIIDGDSFTITSIETGETKTVTLNKKSSTKKTTSKVKDNDPYPKVSLEENKLILNQAAADILLNENVPENRLEVKYMKNGNNTVPVIMNNNAGNKVTKSLTISYRGKARDQLAIYGSVFELQAYPGKSGVYMLIGENEVLMPTGDENVSLPVETPVETPAATVAESDDLDLSDILGEDDGTEVSAMNFEL